MNKNIYSAIIDRLRELIAGTEWEGHVFAVGGCVRDSYLGNNIKDVDLAIDLPMGSIKFAEWLHRKRLTAGRPIYFPKFGTAKLKLKGFGNQEIEIVQTRKGRYDAGTVDCPETVFGSILEDARRRDLTINSLYYDVTRGEILDPLDAGIRDLDAHQLNTPLSPADTFEDDPVRMLRVLRFHARLGWPLRSDIYESMRPYVSGLSEISAPRLGGEFFKAFSESKTLETLDAFRDLGIFDYALPLLNKQLEIDPEAWERIRRMTAIYEAQGNPDPAIMMAILLHNIGLSLMPEPDEKREKEGLGQVHISSKLAKQLVKVMKVDRSVTNDIGFFIANQNRLRKAGPDGANFSDRLLKGLINAAASPERLERLLRFIDIMNQVNDPELKNQTAAIWERAKTRFSTATKMDKAPQKKRKGKNRNTTSEESANTANKKKKRRRWRPRRYSKSSSNKN